nr:FAD-dependent oxidoreductase [Halobacillus sp. Marseille-Q1614]
MGGVSFSWFENPFSAGCFTLFAPNQESDLREYIYKHQGLVHFAGERTSSFHGWVEGAIESGIRAAFKINNWED